MNRKQQLEQKGILLLKGSNEKKGIEFELKYLSSLSSGQRFMLMNKKNQELRNNLEKMEPDDIHISGYFRRL